MTITRGGEEKEERRRGQRAEDRGQNSNYELCWRTSKRYDYAQQQ